MVYQYLKRAEDDEPEVDIEEEYGISKEEADLVKSLLEEEKLEASALEDITTRGGIRRNAMVVEVDGNEYIVFGSSEDAEIEAVERVRNDLETDPGEFNQSLIERHLYMTDTDRRVTANDIADSDIADMSDRDVLRMAKQEGLIEDENQEVDADDLKEKLVEARYDEIYEALKDPVKYFIKDQGLYGSVEELLKSNIVSINYDDAAEEAVRDDGAEHFLAPYDGNEIGLSGNGVAYRIN